MIATSSRLSSALSGFIFLLCSIYALQSNASSSIQSVSSYRFIQNDDFSLKHQANASFDSLVINKNDDSVTVNFSSFKVTSKPLLVHIPNKSNIKSLVIQSPEIQLKNQIKIIGKPVDLVFVNTRSSGLYCGACSFENAGRITFIAGQFTNNVIKVGAGSHIAINSLTAPGANSLEVFAAEISTSGKIDLNLKAQHHPQGGFIIAENGSQIIGAGGINLYRGIFNVNYKNLDIQSAFKVTKTYQPKGIFKAASIGIVATSSITLSSSTQLNTMSDALSSSTRQGEFYMPSEGIFLQIANNKTADIAISGKLHSDKIVTTKSQNKVTLYSSANIMAESIKLLTKGNVYNSGYLDANDIGINANTVINEGTIKGANLTVEAERDFYNSFGGQIQTSVFKATLPKGVFTNGSRTNKSYRPVYQVLKTPTIDMTETKHGLYQSKLNLGTTRSNLAAFIHANDIQIHAKAIENINPYHITKKTTDNWSSGIKINTRAANQVSMQAETNLQLKATNYIRNTSAILGLNQTGLFHVNTPKFYNERYRLEADVFIVSQLTLDSEKSGKYDEANVGTETKITAYSPPGRIYTYGKFKVSDGNNVNGDEVLVNAFSYLEAFEDSHFHQLELKTVGLKLSNDITKSDTARIRDCLLYSRCKADKVTTYAQAETLMSFQGSIYGLNKEVSSETDYEQENLNVLEVKIRELIEEYLAQFKWKKSEDHFSEVTHSKVNGDLLTGSQRICNGKVKISHSFIANAFIPKCELKSFSQSISALLEKDAKDDPVGNTGYTNIQIKNASTKFVKTLPKKGDPNGYLPDSSIFKERNEFQSYALSSDKKTISVVYIQHGYVRIWGRGGGSVRFTFTETTSLKNVMKHL